METQQNGAARGRSVREAAAESLRTLDRRVPGLALMGLACWMAWNGIAFSGSFWLHDITNTMRSENLIVTHLAASVLSLIACSFAARTHAAWFQRPRSAWIGAALAVAGTVLIVITRASMVPSRVLFNLGCLLSGMGTTLLFVYAAPLLGALPPRRSLMALVRCSAVGSLIYLCLNSCSNEVATVAFVLLPAASALLYSVHGEPGEVERVVVRPVGMVPRRFALFLASVALVGAAFELAKAYILIGFAPSVAAESATANNLLGLVLMGAAALALVLVPKAGVARVYSTVTAVLVVILSVLGAIAVKPPLFAALASLACSCFNLLTWSMLAYVVFQAQGGAVRTMVLGNAAMSLGTTAGAVLVMGAQSLGVPDAAMRVLLAVVGVAVLVDVLFVFNERQINELLPPLDEGPAVPAGSVRPLDEDRKGRFVLRCEGIADEHHLSARETEVFVALARGRTAQEFAERENLSIYTVRAHIRAVYAKLDVHSSKELRDLVNAAAEA
jgi:DNA-binding CsgD family transcriptional regulator